MPNHPPAPPADTGAVIAYHDGTKHHFDRFARSAGYLDWATIPDPFRRFEGADLIDLVAPLAGALGRTGDTHAWDTTSYDDLFSAPPQPRVRPGLEAVSILLRFSLGLSAWKSAGGQRWALRVNPSSGNLHPTEAYVVLDAAVAGAAPGVFHYRPDVHALERRCSAPPGAWETLVAGLPAGTFFAALASIHWREAWKYGERAFRYCQHDTGHAIAALCVAAAMMGWHARLVPRCPSASLGRLLGVDRETDFADAEPEEPECLLAIAPSPIDGWPADSLATAALLFGEARWQGRANRLSPPHVTWPVIDAVADATRVPDALQGPELRRPDALGPEPDPPPDSPVALPPQARPPGLPLPPASRLLLQRRSAVAMTGDGDMSLAQFVFLLRRLMPGEAPPWAGLWWRPQIHLALFVHRVRDLDPGLYVLARSRDAVGMLQGSMRTDFGWIRPGAIPDDLPLFLLAPADVRRISGRLSCGQEIAADGYFAAGMLAEFDGALAAYGAWFYRHLFWEAGAIGQMLYLEAEAAGVQGTGIGCYFDDGVHDLLGLEGRRLQSLYHFTVGRAVEDVRLRVEPGYGWEAGGVSGGR